MTTDNRRQTIEIGVTPKVKRRPRMTRRGRVYTPAETLEYEGTVGQLWVAGGGQCFETPVGVSITYDRDHSVVEVWEIPEFDNHSKLRGDLDNYVKATLDGLNKVAFTDDRQVKYLVARKL